MFHAECVKDLFLGYYIETQLVGLPGYVRGVGRNSCPAHLLYG